MILLTAAYILTAGLPDGGPRYRAGFLDAYGLVPFEAVAVLSPRMKNGVQFLRAGKSKEAYGVFSQLVRKLPSDLLARRGLVEAAAGLGVEGSLETRFQETEHSVLADSVQRYMVASAHLESARRLKRGSSGRSRHREDASMNARLIDPALDGDPAVALLKATTIFDVPQERKLLSEQLKEHPDCSPIQALLARAYIDGTLWEQVLRPVGKPAPPPLPPLAEEEKPNNLKAISVARALVRRDPDYPYGYYFLALGLHYVHDQHGALVAMRDFLRRVPPSDPYAVNARAYIANPTTRALGKADNVPPALGHQR